MSISPPLVSVIITCLNGRQWLDKCMTSLLMSSLTNFEVIFVDNGSTDGTAEYLMANFIDPRIFIKKLKINRGFTGGNNYGVDFACAKLLFFLSIDVVISKNTLAELVACYGINDGMLGPRVYNTSNDESMDEYVKDNGSLIIDIFGYPIKLFNQQRLFYVEGCAFLIAKDKFLDVGGFDEKLVTYTEDVDLSWQMWLKGYRNYINDATFVLHFGGSSSVHYSDAAVSSTTYYRRFHTAKNIIRNAIKNYQLYNVLLIIPMQLVLLLMESFYYLGIKRNTKAFVNIISSISWNVVNIFDTWKRRKIIQNTRIKSDQIIKQNMIHYPVIFKYFIKNGSPTYEVK